MQMSAGGTPRAAHNADDVALLNDLPFLNLDALHMSVDGLEAILMVDDDCVAESAGLVAREFDDAFVGGHNVALADHIDAVVASAPSLAHIARDASAGDRPDEFA